MALRPACFSTWARISGIDRAGGLAVFAERDVLGGLADHFPAAELDVHHRLGADDLRGGRDQRDPAERFAHDRDFAHHFVELVGHALFGELVAEVREHAAGDLEDEDVGIHAFVGRAGELRELLIDILEVEAELLEFRGIVVGAARVAFEQGEHAHGVGLGGAVGERDDRGFHGVHAGIDGGEIGGGAEAGGVVGVEGDGQADLAL